MVEREVRIPLSSEPQPPIRSLPGRGDGAPELHNLVAGRRLGKYLLLRPLGRGGMGVVYEAEDTLLRRRVAVKGIADGLGPDAEGPFLRESPSAARLSHPNVVPVYEIDEQDGTVYL